MVNYQFGKIYLITNDVNDKVYVGSSAQKLLCKRFGQHKENAIKKQHEYKSALYQEMRTIGVSHFKIVLYKAFSCNNKEELESEEYRVLDEMKKSGKELLNTRTATEYHTAEVKEKMSKAQIGRKVIMTDENMQNLRDRQAGNKYRFNYGSVFFQKEAKWASAKWFFYYFDGETRKSVSFSCKKYGFWKAKQLCEMKRKEIYPEWKTDEEKTIENFNNIEL